jgi:hypothetical protein
MKRFAWRHLQYDPCPITDSFLYQFYGDRATPDPTTEHADGLLQNPKNSKEQKLKTNRNFAINTIFV